jgi:hypothetical protein
MREVKQGGCASLCRAVARGKAGQMSQSRHGRCPRQNRADPRGKAREIRDAM